MDFLKIAVLNNSGNVGKSMLCEHLLAPRIPNAEIIKIETINDDGSVDEKVAARDTAEVREKIDTTDVCIIDVGASNIETFISGMKKMSDTVEDIDWFIIPTTPKAKQLTDTVNTISELLDMGVDYDRIRVILNMFDEDFSVEKQYSTLFNDAFAAGLELNKFSNQFVVPMTELFDLAVEAGLDYKEVIKDERDFKALIRATKDKSERSHLSIQRTVNSLFKGFDSKLDQTFAKLAKSCGWTTTPKKSKEVANAAQ